MARGVCKLGVVLGVAAMLAAGTAAAQGDGEGIDSQILWPAPGPSNFPTVESSDVVGHAGVAFSALFGYDRKPLGVQPAGQKTLWTVEDVVGADFMWAFGIVDIFQVGLALPVVLDQDGKGADIPGIMPIGADEADYTLASSALRDLRFNAKARFLGGGVPNPDRRDFGLAFDLGVSLPTGDELNFAGDGGFVFAPNAIVDFHRCKFSAALNLGARLRTEKSRLANLTVGHQGTAGLGLTGHYFERRLLLSVEGTALAEFEDMGRVGVEYRGGVGYVPDDAKAITLWLSGGSSAGSGDLLGTPQVRVLLGIVYAPGAEGEALE
ncbi:MAG: hypothetical protein PHU25_20355 [Deltaproteobacteria bacterium]|nr:hypothetical protein [Deltaproteobacteria bacterium]